MKLGEMQPGCDFGTGTVGKLGSSALLVSFRFVQLRNSTQ